MKYLELEKLRESREFKAAEKMEDAINTFGWNPQRFAQSFATWHRTLQQEFFRTIVETIKVAASDEYRFDGRNEKTHELAKKIVDSGILDNAYLPFV